MVKLARGGMHSHRGRSKPRPLFPPGELPLFGPPPAYIRRPGPPVPPPARGPIGYDYGPPPPPMRPPPRLGPPMPPPPHIPMRGRPGGPLPPMPLLQAPVMPPRPLPFMRGRGPIGPRMGPTKKIGKGIKKSKNRRNKKGVPTTSSNKVDGEYYCEVCDRSWMTPEELKEHVSEHITCHFDGCSFSAAPKLVDLHVKFQHDSGIFERIIKTTNMEDIDKWREERKRNFPTLANIEKKIAEKQEKEDRGERIELMNGSFDNNKGRRNKHLKGKPWARNNTNTKKNQCQNEKFNQPGKTPKQLFLSTASLPNDDKETTVTVDQDCNISDDEWISDNQGVTKDAPISNILSALSSAYASGDEDDHLEDSNGMKTVITESDDGPPLEEKIGRLNDLDANMKEETENDKVIEKFSKRKRSHNKNKMKPKPNKMNWQPAMKKRPLTLLEKLLAKEIKQERNYIHQCIRYIISENYFENN